VIAVVDPGPLASVQDAAGRRGWRRYGVPTGGAADAWSARLANRLVGNDDAAAVVEVTLGGATFETDAPATIALTGGLRLRVAARPVPASQAARVAAGTRIDVDGGDGARGYLAVAGGIRVPIVLDGASTDLRAGFGGHEGRALRAGDVLGLGPPSGMAHRWLGRAPSGPIRVLAGPHPAALPVLAASRWTVDPRADRTGVRLDGPGGVPGAEVDSMGLPLGAIQVPPEGRPIVMLADRPVTGGYAVPGCVIRADIGPVAQLLPGHDLEFAIVDVAAARAAWAVREAELELLEPLDLASDAGWAGAHP
jgi:biotin-dependent carboxylase-like uncharacterized protein